MKPLQAIIVAILLLSAHCIGIQGKQQQHYDADAQKYLRQALTDIGSWQRENVKQNLAPQTLAAIDDAQLDALIERYRGLGAFKQLDNLQFARVTAALSLFSSNSLLSYHGNVIFEHGSASLAVTVIASNGGFQIYNFSFGSPEITGGPERK